MLIYKNDYSSRFLLFSNIICMAEYEWDITLVLYVYYNRS